MHRYLLGQGATNVAVVKRRDSKRYLGQDCEASRRSKELQEQTC